MLIDSVFSRAERLKTGRTEWKSVDHTLEMGERVRTAEQMKTIESQSAQETWETGRRMGQEASPGQVIALTGDLGTGKTVFTQGFAAGLGIDESVNSPTFTILQVYEEGRLPLYHFDVYRIGDPEEMLEIGWEDYVFGEGVCLIEWADLIDDLIGELPGEKVTRVEIRKDLSRGADYRRITVSQ